MKHILTTVSLVWMLTATAPMTTAGDLMHELEAEIDRLEPQLIECRRWFHRHPELSNREAETGAEITRRLAAMGYQPRTGIAGHGVVTVLDGGKPGPTVAWRSDIDALPITEQDGVPWRSENEGVMHACGHDVHLTVGLGAAEVLMRHRDQVRGRVLFLFQPAEEGAPPGEPGGAPLVIAEGALTDPRPEAIFGLHVMPTLEVGTIGWRAGGIMAAADRFTITIGGRMTHGSTPHDGVDAVWVAAQVVTALQGIAAREIDARRPIVVSVGSIVSGQRFNIIAGQAVLEGTVRTLDRETWAAVPEALERIVGGVCSAHRATWEIELDRKNPVLVNDPDLSRTAVDAMAAVLGRDSLREIQPIMAAEDFAHYTERIPGFYFHLGVRNEAESKTSYVHTPTFDPDERAISIGVKAAVALLVGGLPPSS